VVAPASVLYSVTSASRSKGFMMSQKR